MRHPDTEYIDHWIDCKITELVEETECEPEFAEKVADEFLKTNIIPLEYVLFFKKYGYVSVEMVLERQEFFDQKRLCDPMRYNHTEGYDEAIFYWENGIPFIRSDVNEGTDYYFASKGVNDDGT